MTTVITIDTREIVPELHETLTLSGRVDVRIAQLPVGDYLIGGLIIERKRWRDLFSSLIEGRLRRQLHALKRSSLRPLIIIEGAPPEELSAIAPSALKGLVSHIVAGFGVPIVWSSSQADSARWMLALSRHQSIRLRPMIRPANTKPERIRDQQLFLVSGIPGIGKVRGGQLLDHFGSVRSLFQATFEELLEVPGMGAFHARTVAAVSETPWTPTPSAATTTVRDESSIPKRIALG
jgi:ERCC4-type nuclease